MTKEISKIKPSLEFLTWQKYPDIKPVKGRYLTFYEGYIDIAFCDEDGWFYYTINDGRGTETHEKDVNFWAPLEEKWKIINKIEGEEDNTLISPDDIIRNILCDMNIKRWEMFMEYGLYHPVCVIRINKISVSERNKLEDALAMQLPIAYIPRIDEVL